MTFITGSEIPAYVKSIGANNAGVAFPPRSGSGKLGGRLGSTSQVFSITKWATQEQKEAAADFIKFMHTPAQLAAYYRTTGVPPSDDRFNFKAIKVPQVKAIYEATAANPAPEIENFRPRDIGYGGIDQAMVQMVTGQIKTPEEATAYVDAAAAKWRRANKLELQLFKQWAAEKIAAES
jgi:ABC-type glycerol-3-phosphate transport system substrate-binding protein